MDCTGLYWAVMGFTRLRWVYVGYSELHLANISGVQLKNHPVETEELYRRMSRRKTDVSFDMNGTTIEKEDRSYINHQCGDIS